MKCFSFSFSLLWECKIFRILLLGIYTLYVYVNMYGSHDFGSKIVYSDPFCKWFPDFWMYSLPYSLHFMTKTLIFYFTSKEGDTDQESIQLSTTPDPRHHMGKL